MQDIPYGSVINWSVPPRLNGFFEKIFGYLQNFFTGLPETHASIILDRSVRYYFEFEASKTTGITRFYGSKYAAIFAINAPNSVLRNAIDKLMNEHIGKIYALPQTVYFIFRWLFDKVGVDTRRWFNPFGFFFLICSELVFRYLHLVAEEMKWTEVIKYLDQWKPNNVHAGDIRIILDWMAARAYAVFITEAK